MNDEALNKYLPLIQNHYSDTVKMDDVEYLEGGSAHRVFKIYDQVFRFPKTKEIEFNQQAESIFSKRFSKITPIDVPVIQVHRDTLTGLTYQTYDFISGVPFTIEYAASLSEKELLAIAGLLGEFLKQLHDVSSAEVNIANQVNTSEEYVRYFLDIISEDKKLINSLLTADEWRWIDQNINAYCGLANAHPFGLKITHSDLLPKHILIDDSTHRLKGIIDFSLKFADPAVDFRYFDRYGDQFIKKVYEKYSMQDYYFDERRKFHARDFLVGYLYLSVRDKEEGKQREYLRQLQVYIAKHPL